jgi:3-methyladenine DNA glycosylase AlkD
MLKQVLAQMRAQADPTRLAEMTRVRLATHQSFGLSVPQLRTLARQIGTNQPLAEELWQTGIPDARILAAMIGDPKTITRSTMDRWAADFDSWGVCDACCYDLFDRTPHAWQKIAKWARSSHEFTRRAAFATLAAIAIHDKTAPDQLFLDALPLVEKYSFDDRNFVRKGVNWALRNIGKRNPKLCKAAIACAERIRTQNTRAARWIAADALRELRKRGC